MGDGLGMDLKLSNQVFNSLKQHCYSEQRRSARLHEKKEHSTAVHVCCRPPALPAGPAHSPAPVSTGASRGPPHPTAHVQDGERRRAGKHQRLHQHRQRVCGLPRRRRKVRRRPGFDCCFTETPHPEETSNAGGFQHPGASR